MCHHYILVENSGANHCQIAVICEAKIEIQGLVLFCTWDGPGWNSDLESQPGPFCRMGHAPLHVLSLQIFKWKAVVATLACLTQQRRTLVCANSENSRTIAPAEEIFVIKVQELLERHIFVFLSVGKIHFRGIY